MRRRREAEGGVRRRREAEGGVRRRDEEEGGVRRRRSLRRKQQEGRVRINVLHFR